MSAPEQYRIQIEGGPDERDKAVIDAALKKYLSSESSAPKTNWKNGLAAPEVTGDVTRGYSRNHTNRAWKGSDSSLAAAPDGHSRRARPFRARSSHITSPDTSR